MLENKASKSNFKNARVESKKEKDIKLYPKSKVALQINKCL